METLSFIKLANNQHSTKEEDFSAKISITLMTNFTDNILQRILTGICLHNNIYPELYTVPYKQYDVLLNNKEGELYKKNSDITFIFFDVNRYAFSQFSENSEQFSRVMQQMSIFCKLQKGMIVFNTLIMPYRGPFGNLFDQDSFYRKIQEYNDQIIQLAKEYRNVHIFDTNRLVHFFGEKKARDYRGLYAFDIPFTTDFFSYLAEEWLPYIRVLTGKMKKCIVVDLDNTLWGGIVGEVGATGIQLGHDYPGIAYVHFQKALLSCYERGILLAINSRNNIADVEEVFEKNQQMILKKQHFSSIKINWNNKADNLVEIAQDLNIGLESLVFFDDDPGNREIVQKQLPEILVPHLTFSPEEYVNILFSQNIFSQFQLTDEDKEKGKMYNAELKRKEIRVSSMNVEEYIAQLGISVFVKSNDKEQVERLAQLTMKTNQFNLTTYRYSAQHIEQFMKSGIVYSGEVRDKFGSYGTTILCMVKISEKIAEIDTFLMSCRIIGRNIELSFLDYIIRDLKKIGIENIQASFIPTSKNMPAKYFYELMDFSIIERSPACIKYELNILDYCERKNKYGHVTIIS